MALVPEKNLLEIGTIVKPHGIKGACVARIYSGKGSFLGELKHVHVGINPNNSKLFSVREAAWMPKGWKLHLDHLDSPEAAESLRGAFVYADRADLPQLEGEYYVHDLTGSIVVDNQTSKPLGSLVSIEPASSKVSHDTWWITIDGKEVGLPGTSDFIHSIDAKAKEIRIANYSELL